MFQIIAALVIGGLVALGAHEKNQARARDALGPDGKPKPKPKTPEELFADGEKRGREAAKAEYEALAARDKAVRRQAREEAQREIAFSIARQTGRAPERRLSDDEGDN